MSMHHWTEMGYGMPLFAKEDNFAKVTAFIRENCGNDYTEEEKEAIEKTCQDSFEYYEVVGEWPCETIANIINKKEGISLLRGFIPEDQEEMIGFEPVYPWYKGTEADRMLTKEEANRILSKYGTILGCPVSEIGKFEAEYFGG